MISNAANPFSRYFAEILRAEGLNEFTATDISDVTPATADALRRRDPRRRAADRRPGDDAERLGARRRQPDRDAPRPAARRPARADAPPARTLSERVPARSTPRPAPGAGIVGQTIQFHGTADRYTLSGAQAVATLYSDATTATSNPAVTLRSVGSNGGQAAAFTYDLARSVVYTRQGNPAWAGQERDGSMADQLIRSDDLFFGAKTGDVQPDWVDLNKVADPAGRRAAAPAREPDRADEPRQEAAAAVLVPPARREGGRGHDRRRPRQRRHRRPLRRSTVATARRAARSPTGSASAAPPTSTRTRRSSDPQAADLPEPGLRDRRCTCSTNCADWISQARSRTSTRASSRSLAAELPERCRAGHQPHALHRLERLGDPAAGRAGRTASASTPTTTTGRGPGSRTARACSPARACRCASPTSTAR